MGHYIQKKEEERKLKFESNLRPGDTVSENNDHQCMKVQLIQVVSRNNIRSYVTLKFYFDIH